MKLLVIQLQEGALYREGTELFSVFQLVEYEAENTRNNSDLAFSKTNGTASAHSMCFSTSSLAIGQNCSVEPIEAAEDKILGACLKEVLLFRI